MTTLGISPNSSLEVGVHDRHWALIPVTKGENDPRPYKWHRYYTVLKEKVCRIGRPKYEEKYTKLESYRSLPSLLGKYKYFLPNPACSRCYARGMILGPYPYASVAGYGL